MSETKIGSLDYTDIPWVERLQRNYNQAMERAEQLREASGWDGVTDGCNHDEYLRQMRASLDRLQARDAELTKEVERLRAGNMVLCLECATECRMDDEGGCATCGCPALLVEGGKIMVGADTWTDVRDGFESATADLHTATASLSTAHAQIAELRALLAKCERKLSYLLRDYPGDKETARIIAAIRDAGGCK